MQYDYIIVGGGSAGSVMANRLSARSANQVLLLEAGIDTPHGDIPPDVHSSYPGTAYFNPAYTWNRLRVRLQPVNRNLPESERPGTAELRAGPDHGRRILHQWPDGQPGFAQRL